MTTKKKKDARCGEHTLVVPALGRLSRRSRVKGQPGLHSETLSQKRKKEKLN
jgi:hypothetical protein